MNNDNYYHNSPSDASDTEVENESSIIASHSSNRQDNVVNTTKTSKINSINKMDKEDDQDDEEYKPGNNYF